MNLNPIPFLKRLLAKLKRLLRRIGQTDTGPASPTSPAGGPGIRIAAIDEQFIAGRFVHRFGARDYKLYLPPSPAGQRPAPRPLLLMLHGCTQTPDDFATGTRMNDAARTGGFLVLYPAQSAFANLQRCWNWFKHNHQQRDRGEAALLADLTWEVVQTHGVDPARVWVAGLSAGGAMAAVLGETYPERFAAVGLHSGVPTGLASDLFKAMAVMKSGPTGATAPSATPPPPTIVFHGDHDTMVHPTNADEAMRPFEALGTRETTQGQTDQGVAYTVHRVRNAAGQVLAEQWMVHGAGHAWSGGSAAGTYTDPTGPDATAAMVAFFQASQRATD
ncbi:PHB depolymerase family esterase [uncultured Sphaerotilus sp.]|uniref:extracellular catalytic domain type 1 short-chain-length polyhydroxyalkanoate depolymerase n=1 Tax=uncultured Sphaerotilus sp. TaxID=474984 RepID=UPI0030CA1317